MKEMIRGEEDEVLEEKYKKKRAERERESAEGMREKE